MRAVLVDTSVWLRMFAGREPYAHYLQELLLKERVLAHDIVYGELLISDKGARAKPLSTYALLSYAKTIAHAEVVSLVRARRLFGVGIGWNDAHLLASTLASGGELYTSDVDLHGAAVKLGVAHKH